MPRWLEGWQWLVPKQVQRNRLVSTAQVSMAGASLWTRQFSLPSSQRNHALNKAAGQDCADLCRDYGVSFRRRRCKHGARRRRCSRVSLSKLLFVSKETAPLQTSVVAVVALALFWRSRLSQEVSLLQNLVLRRATKPWRGRVLRQRRVLQVYLDVTAMYIPQNDRRRNHDHLEDHPN